MKRAGLTLVMTAAVVGVLVGCGDSLSAEQIADLTARVDANQALNERLNAALVAAATAGLGAAPNPADCSADVLDIRNDSWMNGRSVTRAELATAVGGRLQKFRQKAERQRDQIGSSGPDPTVAEGTREYLPIAEDRFERFSAEVDEIGTTEWWRYDVLTVETQRVNATAPVAGTTFTPGHVRGTAFVFDYSTERLVCQLDVEARHRATERLHADGQLVNEDMLNNLLEGRLLNNTRTALESGSD